MQAWYGATASLVAECLSTGPRHLCTVIRADWYICSFFAPERYIAPAVRVDTFPHVAEGRQTLVCVGKNQALASSATGQTCPRVV